MSQKPSWRNSQPVLFSVSQNICKIHWNGDRQSHKGILWTKVLIFQGANPIFDEESLSYFTLPKMVNIILYANIGIIF